MEEKRIVKPWQAGLMLLVGIAVIIVGLLVMKLNNRIVLALDGVIMCLMAWCFGIPYAELQQGIKETVSSMIVAILILLAVGVLVGTWMASGTVPVMIYYGMKVLTPGLFLPVVCILCTLMSTMAGTSWGTLATVGVACMGVAQGLGVPLPAAAGAVCTGAFFGDKVSPLSDSPVITATVCEVPLMEGIRHALISTGPAYLTSLVFYFVYGLRYSGGSVGGEVYEDILSTVSAEFWLSPVLLLPVLVVVVLILMKKPTIPTFIAGIAAGAVMAMLCQGVSLHDILTVMYSGFSADTGSDVVNSMLNRGGFTSMLSTIGLLIAAGIFGAPLRTAGVVDVLLAFVERIAKTSRSMSLGVLILHAVFFTITGAYYVSYPVVGGMVKDLYPEYHLDRKNLMRTMLDTGTGLAPHGVVVDHGFLHRHDAWRFQSGIRAVCADAVAVDRIFCHLRRDRHRHGQGEGGLRYGTDFTALVRYDLHPFGQRTRGTESTARGACAIWRAAIPARSLCRRSAASSLTATSFRARRTRSALRRSWRRRSSSAFPARSTCASSRENRPTCSRSRWRRIIRLSKFCRRSFTPSRARTFRAHTTPRSAIRIF